MLHKGGFGHVDYHNLTAGIAALHVGIKCWPVYWLAWDIYFWSTQSEVFRISYGYGVFVNETCEESYQETIVDFEMQSVELDGHKIQFNDYIKAFAKVGA
jgi:hypothetical protein